MFPSLLTDMSTKIEGHQLIGLSSKTDATGVPNYGPKFILANWAYAYCLLSTRLPKRLVNIDHNTNVATRRHRPIRRRGGRGGEYLAEATGPDQANASGA
jgi:hypothetical protein